MKRLLLITGLLAGAAVTSFADGGILVRFGPPRPPRVVYVAPPGAGYVWTDGYYRWHKGKYKWNNGRWMRPPRGRMVWVPGYWAPQRGGWLWIEGYWR
jgi:hypothetical protein